MKIIKFKKISKNKYRIIFDNNESIDLFEDIIIKYNLLLKKELDSEFKKLLINENNNYQAYDMALNYINIKVRSEKEIINYLKKKNIKEDLINDIISKLKSDGYIDNNKYISLYISDKFRLNKYGPNKIKKELLHLGFNKDEIDEGLSYLKKEDITFELDKLIDKKIKQNKNYGGSILKRRIINYFLDRGFDKEDIEDILNSKEFNSGVLVKKEYDKLYNKYSKKYSGDELERIIKQKLYEKGFEYGSI